MKEKRYKGYKFGDKITFPYAAKHMRGIVLSLKKETVEVICQDLKKRYVPYGDLNFIDTGITSKGEKKRWTTKK